MTRAPEAPGGFLAAFAVFFAVFLVPLLQGAAMAAALVATCLHILRVRRIVAREIASALPFLALPLWALFSALWSEAWSLSLYNAAQLAATALIGLVLARTIPLRTLLAALVFAGFATLGVALAFGLDEIVAGARFTGGMGNHNLIAGRAALTILAAFGVLLDARQPSPARLGAILALLAAVPVLALSRSAGSLVMTLVGIASLAAIGVFALLPRALRGAALVIMLLAAPLSWFAAPAGVVDRLADAGLESLGRERTLTRRTLIWDRAAPLIAERPILGHGFRAFAYAPDTMRAAHLHSEFLELWIGLGLVGMILFALTALICVWGLLTKAVLSRDMSISTLAAMIVAFLALASAEYFLSAPFHICALAFYMACALSVRAPQSESAPGLAGRAL
ncbi:MAG: O-antigen ligase family protein [Hyphomonadaceae bacterium]|nr:O-antigen ligase family protein [Hyphomonadaceae bacterium]